MARKQSRAQYMREYRRRKREERAGRNKPVQVTTEHVNSVTGERAPVAERPPVTPAARVPVRRKRMKSDKEIKSYIANTMMTHGQHPVAFLNIMVGYIAGLQEAMKRDREDEFADRACEQRHPGRPATGVYCRACHDAEMAGKFGTIPGQGGHAGELIFPGEEGSEEAEGVDDDVNLLLGGAAPLAPMPPEDKKK